MSLTFLQRTGKKIQKKIVSMYTWSGTSHIFSKTGERLKVNTGLLALGTLSASRTFHFRMLLPDYPNSELKAHYQMRRTKAM